MNAKPGTIQMKAGKWRIRTQRRGFPVRWEPFTAAWVVHEMLVRSGGLTPAIQGLSWKLASKIAFCQYKQAKALAEKAINGPASITETDRMYLGDWARWCNNLDMMSRVKFAK